MTRFHSVKMSCFRMNINKSLAKLNCHASNKKLCDNTNHRIIYGKRLMRVTCKNVRPSMMLSGFIRKAREETHPPTFCDSIYKKHCRMAQRKVLELPLEHPITERGKKILAENRMSPKPPRRQRQSERETCQSRDEIRGARSSGNRRRISILPHTSPTRLSEKAAHLLTDTRTGSTTALTPHASAILQVQQKIG